MHYRASLPPEITCLPSIPIQKTLKYKVNERIYSGLVYKNNSLETIRTAQLQRPGVGYQ